MLNVRDLRAWYGATQALFGVGFDLDESETLAIVGVNGSGKTTTLASIAGIVKTSGSVKFGQSELQGERPHRRAKLGVTLVPEGRRLFPRMTVAENLSVGRGPQPLDRPHLESVLSVFPEISDRMSMRASNLSGGEQQMLTIARSLMRKPRLLMLDEPSVGLAPRVVSKIYERLVQLRDVSTVTILLVEQSISLAASFSDRMCLMKNGQIVAVVDSCDEKEVNRLRSLAFRAGE